MRQSPLRLVVILLLATLTSCKKDNQPKDDASLFKNTVWTGEFHYTAQPIQPMSVEFNEGGQFTWHELAGEFLGTWKIENGKLTVAFATGSGFTGDISNGNKLTNITGLPGNHYVVDNAALNKDADVVLDNTTWGGSAATIAFKAGNILDLKFNLMGSFGGLAYVRKAKSIRFTGPVDHHWFLVANGTALKGAWNFTPTYMPSAPPNPFELKKQ